MGSSKKKDKKKRKRHRSSSDDDGNDDYDKYSSKKKTDSYVVEDSRSSSSKSTLQSIADNYGYEKNDKKQKKKSKYDEMPETEEYVYDQFGEIVETQDRSISPSRRSGDEYESRSKNRDSYDISVKRKGPVTPPLPSSPIKENSYSKDLNYMGNQIDNVPSKSILKGSKSKYDYESSGYSGQQPIQKDTPGSNQDNIDYNSADYILKKIREQTKLKPSNSFEGQNQPRNDTNTLPSSDSNFNIPSSRSNRSYDTHESRKTHVVNSSSKVDSYDSRYHNNYSKNDSQNMYSESSKYQDEYGTVEVKDEYGTYTMDNHVRSPSPPRQPKKQSSQPLPPGVDYSDDESEQATYGEYRGAMRESQNDSYDKRNDNRGKSSAKPKKEIVREDSPPPSSGKSNESLSIEETNKLRAKLGLKPLSVDSGSSASGEKPYAERSDVHAPAGNLNAKKQEEKMREKLEAIREKKKINQKLRKVKGLGEEDDPVLDSAAAWVAKSRSQEREKQMAQKRAQMLEEMDEEFGVTEIMSKSILKNNKKSSEYGSSNLHGLKVEHRASDLSDASQTILTLQDKDVLDDDEDVLYNVNVREAEKAKLNLKNKKKGPGYKAYDDFDEETGEFKMRTVLDKYDEEIEGQKKDSFRISTDGTADTEGENEMEKIRAILKSQQVSLATVDMKLARDYFTSEEMVSFKKPGKKKRKVRKREVLKADDLLKIELVDSNKDRGSRKLKSGMKNSEESVDTSMDMDIVPAEVDELDYYVAVKQHMDNDEPLLEDDEAEKELQIALQRSRRAKLKSSKVDEADENAVVEKIAKEVLNKPQVNEEDAEVLTSKTKKKAKGAIVLDSTSEFCRTLGEIPTFSIAPNNEPEEERADDDMDIEEPEASTVTATTSGWEQVEILEGKPVAEAEDEDDDVLEAEPIPTGLAATLNLANMKGYLKDGKEKVRKFDPLNLPETKAEVDVEKLRDEEKNKYTRGYERERDRERYDPYAWKEKTNYKPDIKLEYVDNKGRQMNQKEAFRLLSHKFHGKGSGKLKTEKRSKKLLDEKKLQMMSSIDTPLNTAALFKDKQKQSQSAYLVLSGGGKNILSGETLKK